MGDKEKELSSGTKHFAEESTSKGGDSHRTENSEKETGKNDSPASGVPRN